MEEKYREIDELIEKYKRGMKAPRGSELRIKGKTAGEMLLMNFKPLILATIGKTKGIEPKDFDEAYQEGCIAFIEGIMVFDIERGAGFGAFIKRYLQLYFWKRQHKLSRIKEDPILDAPMAGTDGFRLLDRLVDEKMDTEGTYIAKIVEALQRHDLEKSMDALAPVERRVIKEHYFEGLKKSEIAQKRGVSSRSIYQTHSRAIKKLKILVKKTCDL
ncbi:MAG: sigma-70 family RNA polymerase sigma factor [Eubacterium sp.]